MADNRRYGRARAGGIEYAPRVFSENGQVFVPREDDDQAYISRDWFKVVERRPEYDPAKYALKQTGWAEDGERKEAFITWEIVELPPTPHYVQVRRFSKLRLVEFCMERGIWANLKSYIEKLGYYDLFVMAVVFLENDKFFRAGLQAYKDFKVSEGADPEEVQATIDAALDFAFDDYETVEAEEEEGEPAEEA